ncbi:mitochondrial inner membrane protease subunit 1-like [Dreissena polymorpha]|uniref:Peptidase S26 domain-containing protein n=1 Tax=Dreissena polymorpha TaxID=45954 RepID=A0A9D4N253_DREPO|nr:mitochondrial inner membrane protease subunit 1-like [Dreissena polymorpha]KAH3886420.1 hypothetical protein DPMN_010427 [Dreissena polymorpha]
MTGTVFTALKKSLSRIKVLGTVKTVVHKCGAVTVWLAKYGCIACCISQYGVQLTLCEGHSMEPYITNGDIFLAERYSVYTYRLKVGDVVGARSHKDPHMYICKRIIAMEGDTVFNNITKEHIQVPRGHVWLEGDNKDNSIDSRDHGALPYALIQSRLLYKILSARGNG